MIDAISWICPQINVTAGNKLSLVQVIAWCHQVTSDYLSRCWPRFMALLCPNELRVLLTQNEILDILIVLTVCHTTWPANHLLDDVMAWARITVTSLWARWRIKSPASRFFTQPFIQAQIKENIKAQRHWHLCGEFTGDQWIPRTKGQ